MCASGGAGGQAPTCKVVEAAHDEAPHTARGAGLACCIPCSRLCGSSSHAACGRVCSEACSCAWQGCCIPRSTGSGLDRRSFTCCRDWLPS